MYEYELLSRQAELWLSDAIATEPVNANDMAMIEYDRKCRQFQQKRSTQLHRQEQYCATRERRKTGVTSWKSRVLYAELWAEICPPPSPRTSASRKSRPKTSARCLRLWLWLAFRVMWGTIYPGHKMSCIHVNRRCLDVFRQASATRRDRKSNAIGFPTSDVILD